MGVLFYCKKGEMSVQYISFNETSNSLFVIIVVSLIIDTPIFLKRKEPRKPNNRNYFSVYLCGRSR